MNEMQYMEMEEASAEAQWQAQKSCRNCENARHDGSAYRPDLICRLWAGTPVEIVAAFSASIQENRTNDKKAQRRAQLCNDYKEETL